MAFNSVVLSGRLTADPDLKYIPSGKAVVTFSVAVDRPTQKGQEKVADFFSVTAWEDLADLVVQSLSKGSPVVVQGHLRQDRWEKDGQKHSRVIVVASSISEPLWSKKKATTADTSGADPEDSEDVPF